LTIRRKIIFKDGTDKLIYNRNIWFNKSKLFTRVRGYILKFTVVTYGRNNINLPFLQQTSDLDEHASHCRTKFAKPLFTIVKSSIVLTPAAFPEYRTAKQIG
jgi:hypothetical protein